LALPVLRVLPDGTYLSVMMDSTIPGRRRETIERSPPSRGVCLDAAPRRSTWPPGWQVPGAAGKQELCQPHPGATVWKSGSIERRVMARRLPGGEAFDYRTCDHSEEIARLRQQAGLSSERQQALVCAVAAELLQAHDETGISLDEWLAPRMLVELLIGHSIIENEV
jgi:hypothetical protein